MNKTRVYIKPENFNSEDLKKIINESECKMIVLFLCNDKEYIGCLDLRLDNLKNLKATEMQYIQYIKNEISLIFTHFYYLIDEA